MCVPPLLIAIFETGKKYYFLGKIRIFKQHTCRKGCGGLLAAKPDTIMSTNERVGGAHAGSEPALAAHWAVTSILMAAVTVGFVVTHCVTLRRQRAGLRVQNLGSSHEVAVLMSALLLWPLINIVQNGANAGVPCPIYVAWPQLFASLFVSVLMFRTLKFTYKLAQVKRAKEYMLARAGRARAPSPSSRRPRQRSPQSAERQHRHSDTDKAKGGVTEAADHERELTFAYSVTSALRGKRIRNIAVALFVVCFGPVFLLEPNNVEYIAGRSRHCWARASTFVIVAWYVWVIPYICFLERFRLSDPFWVVWKLKVQTMVSTLAFLVYLPCVLYLENLLGTSHLALLTYEILWVVQVVFWGTESLLPLILTYRAEAQAAAGDGQDRTARSHTARSDGLVDTLTDARRLRQFEEHLVNEWALENLEFYKAAILYRLRAGAVLERRPRPLRAVQMTKIRRIAYEIFSVFLEEGAPYQVNLPNAVSRQINTFFSAHEFDCLRSASSPSFYEAITGDKSGSFLVGPLVGGGSFAALTSTAPTSPGPLPPSGLSSLRRGSVPGSPLRSSSPEGKSAPSSSSPRETRRSPPASAADVKGSVFFGSGRTSRASPRGGRALGEEGALFCRAVAAAACLHSSGTTGTCPPTHELTTVFDEALTEAFNLLEDPHRRFLRDLARNALV